MLDKEAKTNAKNKATEWANSQRLECPNCGLIDNVLIQETKAARQSQYNKKEGHSERVLPDIPVVPIVCRECGTVIKFYEDRLIIV